MWKLRSSTAVTLSLALAVGSVAAPTGLDAQTPEQRRLDSLRIRLEDAEEMIEMLRSQIATEAGSGVRTRSRVAFELNGRVLMNAFMNSKETNNADVPMYRRQVPDGTPKGGLGMAIRQTSLGAVVTAEDVLGGRFSGDIDVDFFGGQFPSGGGRTFPLLRIRTARATVQWERAQLMIGQEQPLVSNLNPLSLAAVGTPNFSYAGNLWLWLPQIRYGYNTTTGRLRSGVQVALLAPTSGDPNDVFNTGFDAAERTNTPYAQGRLHLGWGEQDRAGEVGIGYHYGSVNDINNEAQESNAVTLDFLLPLPARFELRGEAFSGQLLNGLGSGGIGQNFGLGGNTPVRSVGGWVQLNHQLTSRLLWGVGYGMDDPNDDDLAPVDTRLLNTTQEAHIHWRPAGPLVFGLEWRSTRTRYNASDYPNTHFNLAFGFEF